MNQLPSLKLFTLAAFTININLIIFWCLIESSSQKYALSATAVMVLKSTNKTRNVGNNIGIFRSYWKFIFHRSASTLACTSGVNFLIFLFLDIKHRSKAENAGRVHYQLEKECHYCFDNFPFPVFSTKENVITTTIVLCSY